MTERQHVFAATPADLALPGHDLRLHALDWGGSPTACTVVFLHGGGLSARTWDVVCDLLRERVRSVAIDLRGHGDSDWAPDADYALGAHVADLRAATTAIGADRLVLAGMSLGGLIALATAAGSATPPLGLVLIDTGPDGSRREGRRRLQAFMAEESEFASIEDAVERAMAFNPKRTAERLRRTLPGNLRQTERGTWTWKYDPKIRRPPGGPNSAEADMQRAWEERKRFLREAASRVACPVLVVRGGESDMFLEVDAERTAAQFAHGRRATIAGATHTVQSDRPYELAAVLTAFLDEIGCTPVG
jgi:pimeloyl-ACP methyl ester carboxylesterase